MACERESKQAVEFKVESTDSLPEGVSVDSTGISINLPDDAVSTFIKIRASIVANQKSE